MLIAAAYLVWAGSQLLRQEMRMHQLRQGYNQLAAQQEELQGQKESLESQIESLTNDPAYLEQLARQMGLVKPNDIIYLPIDPSR